MIGAIIQQIVLGISFAPVGPINIEMLKRGIERGFGTLGLLELVE